MKGIVIGDGSIKVRFNEVNDLLDVELVASVKNRAPSNSHKDEALIRIHVDGFRKPCDKRKNKAAIQPRRVRLEFGRRQSAIRIELLLANTKFMREVVSIVDDGPELGQVDGVETRGLG